MAKPDPWRLNLDAYPFQFSLDTRFQDLDTNGHINNVAFAAIFETGRVRFNRHFGIPPRTDALRRMVAAVEINYLSEADFPAPMLIGCGLGRIGNSSWTTMAAAFQRDVCVATCETVIVMRGPDGPAPISDTLRATMAPFAVRRP